MANPQAENGHVDIAHEIIEALALYRIPGEAMQCLWVVFRKTYGWKKIEDEISLSQFSLMTGLKRSNVSRALQILLSKKILLVIKKDTIYANRYKFNKDFETWEPVIKKDTTCSPVIKKDNEVLSKKIRVAVSKKIHTKETSTKETIKRKTFIKPTVEEVAAYCKERNNNIDPEYWFDKYEGNGWVVGKPPGTPMKNWKAVIRTWEKNDFKNSGLQNNGKPDKQRFLDILQDPVNKSWPFMEPAIEKIARIVLTNMGMKWPELHRKVRDHEISIEQIQESIL